MLTVLDAQRGVPQQLLDRGDRVLALVAAQLLRGQSQREIHDRIVAIERRPLVQIAEDLGDRFGRTRVLRQFLALVDDRARHRVVKDALGQDHVQRLALAGLAERIGRDEPDLDRQTGPGMRRQIVIARRRGFLEVQARQRQVEFDQILGAAALTADHRLRALDPVIIARLIIEAQRGARRGRWAAWQNRSSAGCRE